MNASQRTVIARPTRLPRMPNISLRPSHARTARTANPKMLRNMIASLAFEEAEAEQLRDAVAHQRQAGLRCDWLEPAEVAERFPATAPCLGAMFAPEDGAVDAPALTRALLADAKRLGTRTFATRVN